MDKQRWDLATVGGNGPIALRMGLVRISRWWNTLSRQKLEMGEQHYLESYCTSTSASS